MCQTWVQQHCCQVLWVHFIFFYFFIQYRGANRTPAELETNKKNLTHLVMYLNPTYLLKALIKSVFKVFHVTYSTLEDLTHVYTEGHAGPTPRRSCSPASGLSSDLRSDLTHMCPEPAARHSLRAALRLALTQQTLPPGKPTAQYLI